MISTPLGTRSQVDLDQELYPQSLTYLCHPNHTEEILQLPSITADAEREAHRQVLSS